MTVERPRVMIVTPYPASRGGIAQFAGRLGAALAEHAETRTVGYLRLYPGWVRGLGAAPAGDGAGYELSAQPEMVAWRPHTWTTAARLIDDFEPDIVVLPWWHPILAPSLRFLARRARARGARVAYVCHNARPHEPFPFARALTRSALAESDRLYALSATVARDLHHAGARAPLEVIPHPPTLARQPAASPAGWRERIGPVGGPVVLFFGHVRGYKGLADAIRAMPSLRERVPATLVVAGHFVQSPERFLRLAERVGAADCVRLLPGHVPDEHVAELFDAADLLVLPYRSASQSGVLPLAAEFGVPVVATATGGIPEALAGRGILVPPRDPAALADGMARALVAPPPPPALPEGGWARWGDAILEAARAPAAEPAAPARRPLGRAARVAGWSVVAAFLALAIGAGVEELRAKPFTFSWPPLLGAAGLLLLGRAINVGRWHLLLRGAGERLPLARTARIYTSAELIRFLPGGALHLAARYRFAAKANVSRDTIISTTALDLGLQVSVAVAVFAASIPFWPGAPAWTLALPALATIGLTVLVRYRLIEWALAQVRLLRERERRIDRAMVGRAAAWTALGWIVRGAALALCVASVGSVPSDVAVPVAGVAGISWVAGILAPIAPAGLGVREAAGAALLRRLVGVASGLVAMVLLRLLSMSVEILTAWAAGLWEMRAAPAPVAGAAADGSASAMDADRQERAS